MAEGSRCGKLAYVSEAEARKQAKAIRDCGRGRAWPYRCLHCGFWHLTKRRRK